jgi:hypothetical protein
MNWRLRGSCRRSGGAIQEQAGAGPKEVMLGLTKAYVEGRTIPSPSGCGE